MGYIPIVIALLAFAFLLILVNINSIQARQQSLGLALFNVCQTAKSRHALLKRIPGMVPNQLCPDLPENPRRLLNVIPQLKEIIAAERSSLRNSSFQLQEQTPAKELLRYTTALAVLNQRQYINLKIMDRKVREYNQLLATTPTSLVAALYRVKPVQLNTGRLTSGR